MGPHTMSMNISHTNVGKIGVGRAVDKWHTDSVDYVLIIILSDLADMKGGELRVLQRPDATGNTFTELQKAGVPENLVETVKYTAAGYGIFMQGSKILHTVNGVLAAREPRISLVNSYMTLRPFSTDTTRYHTFIKPGNINDGEAIASVEFARHKAWRAAGQMKALLQAARFEGGPCASLNPAQLSAALRTAGEELRYAADLLDGIIDDDAAFLDEKDNSSSRNDKKLNKVQSRL